MGQDWDMIWFVTVKITEAVILGLDKWGPTIWCEEGKQEDEARERPSSSSARPGHATLPAKCR